MSCRIREKSKYGLSNKHIDDYAAARWTQIPVAAIVLLVLHIMMYSALRLVMSEACKEKLKLFRLANTKPSFPQLDTEAGYQRHL